MSCVCRAAIHPVLELGPSRYARGVCRVNRGHTGKVVSALCPTHAPRTIVSIVSTMISSLHPLLAVKKPQKLLVIISLGRDCELCV